MTSDSGSRRMGPAPIWLVVITMLAYPLIRFTWPQASSASVVQIASAGMAYPLGLYLFRGIPSLAARSRWLWLGGGAIAGLAVAVASSVRGVAVPGVEWLLIVFAGVIAGWSAHRWESARMSWLVGVIPVVVGAVVMYASHWSRLDELGPTVVAMVLEDFQQPLSLLGMTAEGQAWFEQVALEIMRLSPSALVMGLVAQYTVGYLWFAYRETGTPSLRVVLPPFREWRLPLAVTPFMLAAFAGHWFGNGSVLLTSNNVVLSLSVFAAVAGLALIEASLHQWRVSLGVRLLVYVFLVVTGPIGYVLTVVLGLVDSVIDLRRRLPKEQRTK